MNYDAAVKMHFSCSGALGLGPLDKTALLV